MCVDVFVLCVYMCVLVVCRLCLCVWIFACLPVDVRMFVLCLCVCEFVSLWTKCLSVCVSVGLSACVFACFCCCWV